MNGHLTGIWKDRWYITNSNDASKAETFSQKTSYARAIVSGKKARFVDKELGRKLPDVPFARTDTLASSIVDLDLARITDRIIISKFEPIA